MQYVEVNYVDVQYAQAPEKCQTFLPSIIQGSPSLEESTVWRATTSTMAGKPHLAAHHLQPVATTRKHDR